MSDYDKIVSKQIEKVQIEEIIYDVLKQGKALNDQNRARFIKLVSDDKQYFVRFVIATGKICRGGFFNNDAISWFIKDIINARVMFRHYYMTNDLTLQKNSKTKDELIQIVLHGKDPSVRLDFISKLYAACYVAMNNDKDKITAERYTRCNFREVCLLCSDETGRQCACEALSLFAGRIPKKEVFGIFEDLGISANSPGMDKFIECCFEPEIFTVEVTEYNWGGSSLLSRIGWEYKEYKINSSGEFGAAPAALEFMEKHIAEFSVSFLEGLIPKCERRKVYEKGDYPITPRREYFADEMNFAKERLKYLIALKG